MKVAIVADFLLKLGGAERVVQSFLEMYPDADIYTILYDEAKVGSVFPKEKVTESKLAAWPKFLRKRYKYFFPLMPGFIEGFDLSDYDLVISSSSAYSHGVITSLGTQHIVYCHSPMRYAWDYAHKYLEEQNLNFLNRGIVKYFLKQIREWDFLASKRPDVYIGNSKHVKKRIEKYYRRDAEVVYPPVNVSRFKPQKYHGDYFLIVSTLTPYKKIDQAIQLFNKVNRKLVIIGDGPARSSLEAIAGPNIDFLGFVSDSEVTEYMQNCQAFVFPGEEDFGITPVEAMACGKPVLAYRKGGLTESVIEGETGEFFDEQDLDSMEDALGRLILNYKFYDHKSIRKRAEEFSEERFKKEIEKIVEKTSQRHLKDV
ncbi:glycosyltransferase [Candidatus Peregrinibacteria bacterium]|jgi:glycosyltransferase involved in cell wall biosynthesis|nr:glycosyltransferase [Candidatus Peregrinibacteria bacterium]